MSGTDTAIAELNTPATPAVEVPRPAALPYLAVADARTAIDWYVDALGAVAIVEPEVIEDDVESDEAVDAGPQIVKSKRFAIHPMSADEAAERMELIGHGFFFFTNVETSRSAVVYRREDGNVGLIDEAD